MKLLQDAFGETIASRIVSPSRSIDQHPLLVSLAMRNGEYTILSLIDSQVQEPDEMRIALDVIRNHFDSPDTAPVRILQRELPVTTNTIPYISPEESEFQRIAIVLNLEEQQIIQIQKVQNPSQSNSTDTMTSGNSEGFISNEEEFFYGCPPLMANDILQHGFNLEKHCIHGK